MVPGLKMDPRPSQQLFFGVQESRNVPLPLLDHIVKKTLTLLDYKLSDGAQRSLASACQSLDQQQVNRLHLSNNGISGENFTAILQGIAHLSDVKSITYHQNAIEQSSVRALSDLLARQVPYHLEELKLLNVKMTLNTSSALFHALLPENSLIKLALVKLPITESQFDALVQSIGNHATLQQLDLSWCPVRPSSFGKFFYAITFNQTLTQLTMQWNTLTDARTEKKTVLDICQFIKSSKSLLVLDLSHTGLS